MAVDKAAADYWVGRNKVDSTTFGFDVYEGIFAASPKSAVHFSNDMTDRGNANSKAQANAVVAMLDQMMEAAKTSDTAGVFKICEGMAASHKHRTAIGKDEYEAAFTKALSHAVLKHNAGADVANLEAVGKVVCDNMVSHL